jgi:hypothetical protein
MLSTQIENANFRKNYKKLKIARQNQFVGSKTSCHGAKSGFW